VGLRVMYHSTDATGDDRAVTGTMYYPTAEPPEGGWPVVAWAHGTSGLAASCAPSRAPAPPPAFGVEGVRVATDYLGLGPVGELHPYLSAAAEGNAVIDGVAAARAMPEAGAGDQWVVAGVSQGGHAVLVTNEGRSPSPRGRSSASRTATTSRSGSSPPWCCSASPPTTRRSTPAST